MRKPFVTLFLIINWLLGGSQVAAQNVDLKQPPATGAPYIYVLAVGQDAGYPQAGCFKPHCMPGWIEPTLRRGAVSLGLIDPGSNHKYMFEATPNFPEQLYMFEKEAPSSRYNFSGIFLTHAHIGHYAGLMFLGHEAMGAEQMPVYAMPRMTEYLKTNGPWEQLVKYNNIKLMPLKNQQAEALPFKSGLTKGEARLKVTPFIVPHRDEYSETVGYLIQGSNKRAIFIPDINKWEQWETNIAELIKSVDYALIDAAFYADGELPGRDMSKIPHPFVSETMDTLKGLSKKHREKVWFIHMNHTNPLLRADSEQSKQVKSKGFNIAYQGLRLSL
jgi:pyrroloquinoline quinone biosynthesis protein B